MSYAEPDPIDDPWSREIVEAAQLSDLLIIDNVGADVSDYAELLGLTRLLRFRRELRLPLAVSTSFTERELADALSIPDDPAETGLRIASSLFGDAVIVS